MSKVSKHFIAACITAVAGGLSIGATSAKAALTVTSVAAPAGTTFTGAALVTSNDDPTSTAVTGDYVTPTVPLDQTFVPTSTFTLSAVQFYNGGQGGATGTFAIYAVPSFGGGTDTAGYVNTSFSTDLIGGGNGLAFQVFGNSGNPPQQTTFALSGADQITLTAGTRYAVEFDITGGSAFNLLRTTTDEYANGGAFQTSTSQGLEYNFNGTAPANGRGERDAFFTTGGGANDFVIALDAVSVPEPTTLGLIGAVSVGLLGRRRRAGLSR